MPALAGLTPDALRGIPAFAGMAGAVACPRAGAGLPNLADIEGALQP